jgi:hypothetical protein
MNMKLDFEYFKAYRPCSWQHIESEAAEINHFHSLLETNVQDKFADGIWQMWIILEDMEENNASWLF